MADEAGSSLSSWRAGLRRALAVLRPRGLRILFSARADWQAALEEAFRDGEHRLTFAPFDDESIGAHDLLVPTTIADLGALHALGAASRDLRLPIPSAACVALCNDKPRLNSALVEAGFAAYVPPWGEGLAFPYVLKKRIDEGGSSVHVVGSWARSRELAALHADPDYFAQELVPGVREFATHALMIAGRIRYAMTMEFVFANPRTVKGRNVPLFAGQRAHPVDPGLLESMLRAIGFEGLCCFNYKVVEDKPMLFEINPRFGFSLCAHFPDVVQLLAKRSIRARRPWAFRFTAAR